MSGATTMPADLVALGFDIRRHLEDYVLGACLVGCAQDRAEAFGVLEPADLTGRFRQELFGAMQELDGAGKQWLLVDAYEMACTRSGLNIPISDFLELEENVATAALLPQYARRLRDMSLARRAELLHDRALREGDENGAIAARLVNAARDRAALRACI